jgi:flavin reductase (DIM6/NTAB) family NADH-FMN oxidoreductase RutF
MDETNKKTALRMIPYGLYILTTESSNGQIAAATVNWVTQTAFAPPLLVVGVKTDSGAHRLIKETGHFAVNILGKDQGSSAFAFFKAVERDGDKINGHAFRSGSTGSPILENVPAYVECTLIDTIEKGDHSVFLGEVVDAGAADTPEGRPDDLTLTLKDLGDTVFYGG